jgi:hypothetical protein
VLVRSSEDGAFAELLLNVRRQRDFDQDLADVEELSATGIPDGDDRLGVGLVDPADCAMRAAGAVMRR